MMDKTLSDILTRLYAVETQLAQLNEHHNEHHAALNRLEVQDPLAKERENV